MEHRHCITKYQLSHAEMCIRASAVTEQVSETEDAKEPFVPKESDATAAIGDELEMCIRDSQYIHSECMKKED